MNKAKLWNLLLRGVIEPKHILSEYTYPLLVFNVMPPDMIVYVLGTGFNAFYRCVSPTPAPTAKNHQEII